MIDHEAQAARANQLYDEGLQAFRRQEQERSKRLNEESLKIFRDLGEPVGTAKAMVGLARVAIRERDFTAVRRHAAQAASLLDGREEYRTEGAALHMLAAVHRMSGEDAEAATLYERTTALFEQAGHEAGVAGEFMNHGYARLHLNQRDKARELFSASLTRTVTLGDPVATAFCVTACAAFAATIEEDTTAALLYGAALAELERAAIVLDPDDQTEYDRYSNELRGRMGDQAYATEEARGRALPLSDAVTRAREILGGRLR